MADERRTAAEEGDEPGLLFAFRGEELLVLDEGAGGVRVPRLRALEGVDGFRREVGTLGGVRCVAAAFDEGARAPEGMAFRHMRSMLAEIDADLFAVAGRARQVVDWHRTHRYCGRCGAETVPGAEDLARRCPACGMVYHPRISPAAIVLVRRGDRVLLARSPHFPKGLYSAIAGFVEPGESLEETVRREVREETGVEVGNVRYFGSEPWPFPNSLMAGFLADWAGGELRVDREELEDAGWYGRDELPMRPPRLSIARRMIDAFAEGRLGDR